MEVELGEMMNELESLKQSLTDPSQRAPIDKVFCKFRNVFAIRLAEIRENSMFCGNGILGSSGSG